MAEIKESISENNELEIKNPQVKDLDEKMIVKKQITGIIINFWSKYKQRLLNNIVKNNKYLSFISSWFDKNLSKNKKVNSNDIIEKFSSRPQYELVLK